MVRTEMKYHSRLYVRFSKHLGTSWYTHRLWLLYVREQYSWWCYTRYTLLPGQLWTYWPPTDAVEALWQEKYEKSGGNLISWKWKWHFSHFSPLRFPSCATAWDCWLHFIFENRKLGAILSKYGKFRCLKWHLKSKTKIGKITVILCYRITIIVTSHWRVPISTKGTSW